MVRISAHTHALRFILTPLMTIAFILAASIQFSLAQSGLQRCRPNCM